MSNSSKFYNDLYQTYDSVDNTVDSLMRKIPEEMVAFVLLSKAHRIIEELTDLSQWELIKGKLTDITAEFDRMGPHLSNLIDFDLDAEKYSKRHDSSG